MNAQFALFRPRDPVGRRETPGAPLAMTRDPAGFTSKSWVWLTCVTSSPSSGPWLSAPASVRCGCFCGAVSGLLFELQKHNAPWPAPQLPAWPPRCRHPESRAPPPHAARTPGSCATWSRGPGPSVTDAPAGPGGCDDPGRRVAPRQVPPSTAGSDLLLPFSFGESERTLTGDFPETGHLGRGRRGWFA